MPLYEFQCDDCSEEFEELLSPRDSLDEVVCPTCGSPHVHKLLSGFSLASPGGSQSASASSCSSRGGFG